MAFLCIGIFLKAAQISVDVAQKVAVNFILKQVAKDPDLKNFTVDVTYDYEVKMTNSSKAAFYIFDIAETGFIIVAGDDNVYPILGFSFNNSLNRNNMSPELAFWLDNYVKQITYTAVNPYNKSEISNIWETYMQNKAIEKSGKYTQVEPLLLTIWNQDNFYNAYCPEDIAGPGGHVYAGCVATAMGQIMKYYNYPPQGNGTYSYNDWTYGTQYANFGNTNYNWTAMVNSVNSYNNAVAELLYHCGVSVDMGYSVDGSGASSDDVVPALVNYFGYSNAVNIKEKQDYSESQWINMLKSNLDNLMPLYYSGYSDESGHAFDFDGYYDDALGTHFHINWGWGGYGNGYFYINNLASPGGNFNNWHQAIFNIIPGQNYPSYCNGSKTLTQTSGTFDDGSGIDLYPNNASCSWLIDPTVNVINIKLNFEKFDTESASDIVTVYDGDNSSSPVLGVFSGSNMPSTITSTAKKMLITFTTNGSVQKQGWAASYTTTKPVYCSGVSFLNDASGFISDGSGLYNYNENTNCRWRIEPAGASSITLTFTEFDVQANEDVLDVFDVSSSPYNLLDTYTGSQLPASKTYNVSKLLLWFKSLNNPKSGWSLNYNATVASVENHFFTESINIYPNPAKNELYIDIDKLNPECLLHIFDIKGCLVKSLNIYKINNTVDIKDLKSGIYTFQLIFPENIEMHKFIKL